MPLNDRRLTGRDVLAKTFQAKTKRGFDPIEVDAYLELVAAQIDVLHGDLQTLQGANAASTETMALPATAAVEQQNQELLLEIATLRAERDEYANQITQFTANEQALRAENEQLRTQLTSIAPPPPVAVADQAPVAVPVVAAPAAVDGDERASEESFELVLRMARRSAEETIAEAHSRADQIVAEANLTASQIAKESDRKAYEAANQVQAELASLNADIENQQSTLQHLQTRTVEQRTELRGLAQRILTIADEEQRRYEGAEVVDLRDSAAAPVAEAPTS